MRVVELVINRFPDKASVIRRLYLCDENFRNVCDDYALCLESLGIFEAKNAEKPVREVREFRVLRQELEIELETLMASSPQRR